MGLGNNIYVGLRLTTLSRRLTMHFSDTSSITLKNIPTLQLNFEKLLLITQQ